MCNKISQSGPTHTADWMILGIGNMGGFLCWIFFGLLFAQLGYSAIDWTDEIRSGGNWCGLEEDGSRTQNIHKLLPSIRATRPDGNIDKITAHNQFIWICQKPFGREFPLDHDPQYITMYDIANRLPVYSVFISDLEWSITTNAKNEQIWKLSTDIRDCAFEKAEQQINYNGQAYELAKHASFTNSGLDRGHLFAAQFATDKVQKKATYRITNMVAQDPSFNHNQWKLAETHLLNEGMRKCKHPDENTLDIAGVPIVFTGAVTGFQTTRPFQIGNMMQVPTHMWTTMLCLSTTIKKPTIIGHMSFIGSNYQDSIVHFYRNFDNFQADLKKMYNSMEDQEPFPLDLQFIVRDQGMDSKFELPKDKCRSRWDGFELCTLDISNIEAWENEKVTDKRATFEIETFIQTMMISGFDVQAFQGELILKAKGHFDNRRKREVSMNDEGENPNQVSFLLMKINDTDPSRDMIFSQCTLKERESSTNETIDEHTIDIENKKYYEKEAEGDAVEFKTMGIDGTETPMPKELKKERIIHIVLTPRTP